MTKEYEVKRVDSEDLRPLTKEGGYEVIPRELVLGEARKLGLSKKEIPEIRVEDVRGGYIDKTPEGKTFIVIPRREPKWKVPDTLRHELSHIKAGYVSRTEFGVGSWESYIENELEALQIQSGGRLTSNDLEGLVITLVLEEEQPKRETTSLVMNKAREMGCSERSITIAKRWLKTYWKALR